MKRLAYVFWGMLAVIQSIFAAAFFGAYLFASDAKTSRELHQRAEIQVALALTAFLMGERLK